MNISWSADNGCYIATVPEFPGLSAFGETPEEAAREAMTAGDGFIQVHLEDGQPLPSPSTVGSLLASGIVGMWKERDIPDGAEYARQLRDGSGLRLRKDGNRETVVMIRIERLPEGVYLATSNDIPGLVAQGRTVAETLEAAGDVARKLMEARGERNREEPSA